MLQQSKFDAVADKYFKGQSLEHIISKKNSGYYSGVLNEMDIEEITRFYKWIENRRKL